jgi:hypothetical protein
VIAFVVAAVVNYLQGYYSAKRSESKRSARLPKAIAPTAAFMGGQAEGVEQTTAPLEHPYLTGEIPREWLETAIPRSDSSWAEQSIDWAEDRRFSESLESIQGGHPDEHYPIAELGLINPATGLPMLGDGPVDIGGNPYGEDSSQHDWNGAGQDSWNSDSFGTSSSSSSWDDKR